MKFISPFSWEESFPTDELIFFKMVKTTNQICFGDLPRNKPTQLLGYDLGQLQISGRLREVVGAGPIPMEAWEDLLDRWQSSSLKLGIHRVF